MYAKINSIPYYQVDPLHGPYGGSKSPFQLLTPLHMTFEVLNGRSYSEPQIFGPYLWFILHAAATALPVNNSTQQGSFITFMKNCAVLIPCQVCREHAYTYILKTIDYAKVSTKEGIFRYLWAFHNMVNSRVANPKITFAKAKALYGYDFPQRVVLKNLNTGEVTNQPLDSSKGYGQVLCICLLVAAVYYPEHPTGFIQEMMRKVIQNLDWMVPNLSDKDKTLTYLAYQNVDLAVTHRERLFGLFYGLLNHLFTDLPFRTLEGAKHQLNFYSFGQGQVVALKY